MVNDSYKSNDISYTIFYSCLFPQLRTTSFRSQINSLVNFFLKIHQFIQGMICFEVNSVCFVSNLFVFVDAMDFHLIAVEYIGHQFLLLFPQTHQFFLANTLKQTFLWVFSIVWLCCFSSPMRSGAGRRTTKMENRRSCDKSGRFSRPWRSFSDVFGRWWCGGCIVDVVENSE